VSGRYKAHFSKVANRIGVDRNGAGEIMEASATKV
jgi:hypothetical protein